MKTIKVALIATIITALIICTCAYALPVKAEEQRPEFYPKLAIVTNTIHVVDNLYMIECRDKNGNIWGFYDDECTWTKGDIANLFMRAAGETEESDEIVEVYWEGYTKNIEGFFSLVGWH
jgi:hypothetical protein